VRQAIGGHQVRSHVVQQMAITQGWGETSQEQAGN
jgi:hypothetical protein